MKNKFLARARAILFISLMLIGLLAAGIGTVHATSGPAWQYLTLSVTSFNNQTTNLPINNAGAIGYGSYGGYWFNNSNTGPWLNTIDGNYIYYQGSYDYQSPFGVFSFAQVPAGVIKIGTVVLNFYDFVGTGGTTKYEDYLWNGTDWSTVGQWGLADTSWSYHSDDFSQWFTSITTVNSAKLSFDCVPSTSINHYIALDYAYLNVSYIGNLSSAPGTVTTTFTAQADAYVLGSSSNYLTAASVGQYSSYGTSDPNIFIANNGTASPGYNVSRGYVLFNTATLGPSAVVVAANLLIYSTSKTTGLDNVTLQSWNGGLPIDITAFDNFSGVDQSDGLLNMSLYSIGQYLQISLTQFSCINVNGNTTLCLRMGSDYALSQPNSANYYNYSSIAGGNPELLMVTYNPSNGTTFTFNPVLDGSLFAFNTTYNAAHNYPTYTDTSSVLITVADAKATTGYPFLYNSNFYNYEIARGYLCFNTASLGGGVQILSMSLSLYFYGSSPFDEETGAMNWSSSNRGASLTNTDWNATPQWNTGTTAQGQNISQNWGNGGFYPWQYPNSNIPHGWVPETGQYITTSFTNFSTVNPIGNTTICLRNFWDFADDYLAATYSQTMNEYYTFGSMRSPHPPILTIVCAVLPDEPKTMTASVDFDAGNWVQTENRYYNFLINATMNSGNITDLSTVKMWFTIPTVNGSMLCTFIFQQNFTNNNNGMPGIPAWNVTMNPAPAINNQYPVLIQAGNTTYTSNWMGGTYDFIIEFTDTCEDAYISAIPIYASASNVFNQTTGAFSTGTSFFLYSHGGFSLNYWTSQDVTSGASQLIAGLTPGGCCWNLYADNNSEVFDDCIWNNLQHVKLCPSINALITTQSSYGMYYGIDYMNSSGSWVNELTVYITPIQITFQSPIQTGTRFIEYQVSWYQNFWAPGGGTLIKTELVYMFHHGQVGATGAPFNHNIWIDFWFDTQNASTTVGGRVNAYEYPMQSSAPAYIAWLSSGWGVLDNASTDSMCITQMYDSSGNVLLCSNIKLLRVWNWLLVPPGTVQQNVSIPNLNVIDYTFGDWPLTSISTPAFDPTLTPAMPTGGLFGFLAAAFSNFGTFLSNNVLFGGLRLWPMFVNFLDTIAGWFGAPHFFSNLFSVAANAIQYIANSIIFIFQVAFQLFLLIYAMMGDFLGIVSQIISNFVLMFTMVTTFFTGGLGSGINMWNAFGMSTWIEIFFIFYPLYLIILWDEEGSEPVLYQLGLIFGILTWLFNFFYQLLTYVIQAIMALVEAIPIVE